jgi:hypothetical protein
MSVALWWSLVAWPWLKKNWLYVLFFPVVALAFVIAYIQGKSAGRVVVVDKREESDAAAEFEKKVEARKQSAIDELDRQLAERTEEVVKEHTDAINKLTEKQRGEADELLDNPDALRQYLLGVGGRARGTPD